MPPPPSLYGALDPVQPPLLSSSNPASPNPAASPIGLVLDRYPHIRPPAPPCPPHLRGALTPRHFPPPLPVQSSNVSSCGISTSMVPDTLNWTAPEVVSRQRVTEKSDCYSLGVVLWELFTGRVPFDEPEYMGVGTGQRMIRVALLSGDRYHPPIPSDMPREPADLLREVWNREPDLRPTAQQIVNRLVQMSGSSSLWR